MKTSTLITTVFGLIAGVFLLTSTAHADLKQMKAYKEAYPDTKPKCIDCHVADLPKKDDGAHDNNDYGKAVMAEAKKTAKDPAAEVIPTADAYKAAGTIENFKK
ncbi:MAG: hypothetical protein HQL22_01525 [Candidatus Omnitrophica bacterium]|nr:hypothetical protein [Candidatus Omnitrophota bacterium]